MGYRDSRRFRKFYWEQVEATIALLERYVKESSSNFDVKKYLMLCEQLGQDPDPNKMPLEASAFPYEVQVAFFMFDLLSDRWDGMSGTYLGKDWSSADFLFKVYHFDVNKKDVIYFAKLYENLVISDRMQKQKAKEKRAKSIK